MDLESALEHLSSKPLLGYQLDASHLHNVLQTILRNGQQQVQAINSLAARVGTVEGHVESLHRRLGQVEGAIGKFGGAEELAALRQSVGEIAKTTELLTQSTLPGLKRELDHSTRKSESCTTALQQLAAVVPQLEQASNALRDDVDSLSQSARGANDAQRQMAHQLQQLAAEHSQRERTLASQNERAEQQLREIQGKADRIERDISARLAHQLEELNKRTNENFMEVESSARAVDSELNRLRTDVANVRAEMNTFDNDTRFKFTKVTDDVDNKFNMLLAALQNIERNNSQLDTVLIEAGRALTHSRAPSNAPTPSNYGGAGTPLYGPGGVTTTTTTLGEGGGLSGRVYRSQSSDFERHGSAPRTGAPMGGTQPNFRML